ncbi:MAG: HAD family hydrolase [Ilumatobacteraceae bacterium]
MLPRLIATDLDGTLLDPTGQLRPRSAAALQAAADAGIIVVFATGRPPIVAGIEVAAAGHGVHYGVMANGTIICTLPDAQVLHAITFSTDMAREAVHALRAADPDYGFALATDRGFTAEAGFHERMPVQHGANEPVADALAGHDGSEYTIKLLAFHHRHGAHELLQQMPSIVGPDLVVSHMGAEAVEIAPAGADKGVGLRWLCAHLDIDGSDVLAFGDEINDLPMFEFAGRRIAVENANPAVRDAADEVTASNADEGVAETIERLLAEHR